MVAVDGLVTVTPAGYPMTNLYIGIANKALALCVKLWTELGLTPSARSRVSTVADEPGDEFSEFDKPCSRLHYGKITPITRTTEAASKCRPSRWKE